MKTTINRPSWKSVTLAVTASLLMSGVASAGGPTPTPAPIAVTLPTANLDNTVPIATVILQPVTTANIDAGLNYVGFQGDFLFDENVVTFSPPLFLEKAGLTAGNWNVSGNILPGSGPIRTLRVSAFSNDFTPLSGAGTLYNLRMLRVNTQPGASTPLAWQPDPDNFFFIDANLDTHAANQINGFISITGTGPTATPTPLPPTPTPGPTGTPTPTPGPITVTLPTASLDNTVPIGTVILQPVTTSNIDVGLNYVGFQGDFLFDENVVTFSPPLFVEPAGLTAVNWNVSANILPGSGPVRTLRVSAFSNDFTPLSGAGTLYNLRMLRVNTQPGASTPLAWQPDPDNFIYIDANLDTHAVNQINGFITITGTGPTATPTPTPIPPTPTPTPTPTASPTPTTPPPTATPTATATVSPTPSCPPVITQSTSQAITAGNSISCNGGAPNFFHADNSYWRAFNMGTFTGGQAYNITAVSFGIERAVANPAVGHQPVIVRLYLETTGIFPTGTMTQIGTTTVDVTDQTGTVLNVLLMATVPTGTTELIMEVFTPSGQPPVNNSFSIGSNAAAQTGTSYISAAACMITTPTDVATLGFPNMHMVFNVTGHCGPTPTPGPTMTPSPTPTPTPTPTHTPTPTPTHTPTPTPTHTPTPTPTPTPTTPPPTPTPTATPTPTPGAAQALNLSTRLRVEVGVDNAGIGGFIITGSVPKEVLLRAIGPSIGVANSLADPTLALFMGSTQLTTNNNWKIRDSDGGSQQAEIEATGIPPTNDLESAIHATLAPGAYTAILRGNGTPGTGVALVEIYDLAAGVASKLGDISTRAFVSTGNDVVIAGFILGNATGDDKLVIRGLGPSLSGSGLSNVLANPTLNLFNSSGTSLQSNDNWQDGPNATEIMALGLGPTNPLESAILATVPPGSYTAILSGVGGGTGLGLAEVYDNPTVP